MPARARLALQETEILGFLDQAMKLDMQKFLPRYTVLSLIMAVAALMDVVLMVAALPALMHPHAMSEGTAVERAQSYRKESHPLNEFVEFESAASLVKGTIKAWHTAQLSDARQGLVAVSLPSQGLALFAGGLSELMPNQSESI
jgi:hypothetical protein